MSNPYHRESGLTSSGPSFTHCFCSHRSSYNFQRWSVRWKWSLPSLDTAYLATDKFGNVIIKLSCIGLWAIICALVLACLTIIILNWKADVDIKDSITVKGSYLSFLPIFNTASEVGYGSVIASLAGFIILRDFLVGIALTIRLISEAIVINVLAGITGSASGGLKYCRKYYGGNL